MPSSPPSWPEILTRDFGQIGRIPSAPVGPVYRGRYLHWEKLRRLTPPDGLRSDGWWALTKLARRSLFREIPLRSGDGAPFVYAATDLASELLHRLDKDAAAQIPLTDPVTNLEMRDRYVISSLMEEAITSSQVEGAATTRVVAKEMLRTGRKPRDRGEQMIKNNYIAIQHIRSLAGQALTADIVFELHRILTTDAIDKADGAGRLRHSEERIFVENSFGDVLHTPPQADELAERMQLMCDFANGKTPSHFIHPVERAIILHFWLAYDHPFIDGNGRCARALFYWSMLRSGYWLCEFISISQFIRAAPARYGRAFLYTETDGGDLTYFMLYHLDLIRRGIDGLQQYIKRKMAEVGEAERLLRDSDDLNFRQIALLSHALRHPGASYSIESHRRSHNTVYETARRDLRGLVERGFLVARIRGLKHHFAAASNLKARMKKRRGSSGGA